MDKFFVVVCEPVMGIGTGSPDLSQGIDLGARGDRMSQRRAPIAAFHGTLTMIQFR
jgi:hypothetical protein